MTALNAHVARYAPFGHCPVFQCGSPLPGPYAVLCSHHYFCVPADQVKAAIRMKIRAAQGAGPAFEQQAETHVKALVARIEKSPKRGSCHA